MTYDEFIRQKIHQVEPAGFDPLPILAPLFPWQTAAELGATA